jgi:hypothetical protein
MVALEMIRSSKISSEGKYFAPGIRNRIVTELTSNAFLLDIVTDGH